MDKNPLQQTITEEKHKNKQNKRRAEIFKFKLSINKNNYNITNRWENQYYNSPEKQQETKEEIICIK